MNTYSDQALPVLKSLTQLERRDDEGEWLDITHIHIILDAEAIIRAHLTGSPLPTSQELDDRFRHYD